MGKVAISKQVENRLINTVANGTTFANIESPQGQHLSHRDAIVVAEPKKGLNSLRGIRFLDLFGRKERLLYGVDAFSQEVRRFYGEIFIIIKGPCESVLNRF